MKLLLSTITLIFLFSTMFAQVENRTSGETSEKKLVENINHSKYVDFAPSISADGRTMIFESDRNKGWKLFETKLNDSGQWSIPVSVSAINDFGRKNDLIAGPNISYDGNDLYFFGFFMLMSESEDIFVSHRSESGWSEPSVLPAPVNTEGYEGFPSISSDGNMLFFIRVNESNPVFTDSLENEEPCFEIWKTNKKDNGQWTDPVKLPEPINMGCERSPKIMADGKTLLFSSIREGGKGLYDMYQATYESNNSWSNPIALDYVNTTDNDLSPCISASGDLMYYYSNNDIYEVPIPPKYRQQKNITVEGYVTNSAKDAIAATVVIVDQETGDFLGELENNSSDGWYSLVLTKGHNYNIIFKSDGFVPQEYPFDLRVLEEYREEHLNVELFDKVLLKGLIIDEELLTPEKGAITIRNINGESLTTFADVDAFDFEMVFGEKYLISIGVKNHELLLDTITTSELTKPQLSKKFKSKPKKVKVQMDVIDLTNDTKVKSRLKFNNKNRNETIEVNSDDFVDLRTGGRYIVESTSDGYFFGSTEIIVDELVAGPDGIFRSKNPIVVTRIAVNASLVLEGIRFETGSYDLSEGSINELERIIQMMTDNPNIVVEISAHTDDIGEANYNLNLSKKRAQSVVKYLVDKGISESNLVSVGYGMNRPAVPNDSEENRAINRRVEMSIVKIN